jgi:hypothetical protein
VRQLIIVGSRNQRQLTNPPSASVSLAEAVTYMITGVRKDRDKLFRAYRKGGYKFSTSIVKQFDLVCHKLSALAAGGRIELRGQKQEKDGAELHPRSKIPPDFFKDPVVFDVMRNIVEPDSAVGDNWINPFPRYLHLGRQHAHRDGRFLGVFGDAFGRDGDDLKTLRCLGKNRRGKQDRAGSHHKRSNGR